MRRSRLIRVIAGALVTASAVLSLLHSPWWIALTAFVGLNLLQYGFTDWCLMEKLLKRLGIGEA